MNPADDYVLSLETRVRALTQTVIRLADEKEQAEIAVAVLRDENEALCALVTAIARGEIVIPMPIEVRH